MSARSLYSKLRNHYKLVNDLKVKQVRVLDLLMARKNVFTVLPTGFGKSLIFTVYPLMMDEAGVVVQCYFILVK